MCVCVCVFYSLTTLRELSYWNSFFFFSFLFNAMLKKRTSQITPQVLGTGEKNMIHWRERGMESGNTRRIFLERTRECRCQSDKHCFKGNVRETSERRGGAHTGFFKHIDTTYSWNEWWQQAWVSYRLSWQPGSGQVNQSMFYFTSVHSKVMLDNVCSQQGNIRQCLFTAR